MLVVLVEMLIGLGLGLGEKVVCVWVDLTLILLVLAADNSIGLTPLTPLTPPATPLPLNSLSFLSDFDRTRGLGIGAKEDRPGPGPGLWLGMRVRGVEGEESEEGVGGAMNFLTSNAFLITIHGALALPLRIGNGCSSGGR